MEHVDLSMLSSQDIECILPLIANTTQKPHRFRSGRQSLAVDQFCLRDLMDLLSQESGRVIIAKDGGRITGFVACADLPWDSRIIGKRMSALKYLVVDSGLSSSQQSAVLDCLLAEALSWLDSCEVDAVLGRAYTNDPILIHAFERCGFLLVDTLLDYVFDFTTTALERVNRPSLAAGYSVRPYVDSDAESVVKVAAAAFSDHYGRFHADERISKQTATRMYEEWIVSSIQGYADRIILAEVDGEIVGFSIWKGPSAVEQDVGLLAGHYSIGAVNPQHKGRGLFGVLTYAGMEVFVGTVDYLEGPTHANNYGVQQAYAKLLWKIVDARHSFHKWLR